MARAVQWSSHAWQDFLEWPTIDKTAYRKIVQLVKECQREEDGLGTGKAEKLSHNLSGWSSKRIDQRHRLVYRLEEKVVYILSCRDHY